MNRASPLEPLAGFGAPPPPFGPFVAAAADEPPGHPTSAEVAKVRALPLDCRSALCADGGPGWAITPDGVAMPRLLAPAPSLIGTALDAWLPAGLGGIVDLIATSVGVGRRSAFQRVAGCVEDDQPIRLAALHVLARTWR